MIKSFFVLTAVLSTLVFMALPSFAEVCGKWGEGEKTGQLNSSMINEASGIAVSRKYPGRLYHVNDSGGGPYFYTTDIDGSGTKGVKIDGIKYKRRSDYEDLGLGRCGPNSSCLFIADIGDNRERRKHVELILIEEQEDYGRKVSPHLLKLLKGPTSLLSRLTSLFPTRPITEF